MATKYYWEEIPRPATRRILAARWGGEQWAWVAAEGSGVLSSEGYICARCLTRVGVSLAERVVHMCGRLSPDEEKEIQNALKVYERVLQKAIRRVRDRLNKTKDLSQIVQAARAIEWCISTTYEEDEALRRAGL